jgi:hypothetical protein
MRIVFTNYDIALMYTCDHEAGTGHCYAGQTSVDIISRSRNPNPDLKFPLLRRIKDLCVDPNMMEDVDHSGNVHNGIFVHLSEIILVLYMLISMNAFLYIS